MDISSDSIHSLFRISTWYILEAITHTYQLPESLLLEFFIKSTQKITPATNLYMISRN